MKRIAILGSTGSIGEQTLDVVRRFPQKLQVLGIAARRQDRLVEQATEFQVPHVVIGENVPILQNFPQGTTVRSDTEALTDLATHPDADIVIVATVGRAGLQATLAALRAGKCVALANKEVLVMAGAIVMATAEKHNAVLFPIDSEHSAIWQCLVGEDPAALQQIILTASGGAFRHLPVEALPHVTPEEALQHPTWKMGPKVTVDSATLLNKGLEVIEAHWLFRLGYDRISVALHPTSTVHSLVQFVDGSFKAQLGVTDMRIPIQYALSYPERWTYPEMQRDLLSFGDLQFTAPDLIRYPCLTLALEAGRLGGTYPAALCGADEAAVDLFLGGSIPFTAIPEIIDEALQKHQNTTQPELDDILAADTEARRIAYQRKQTYHA